MKRTSGKARRYCFTWNNPDDSVNLFIDGMDYLIYQLEEGKKKKTPHYQGYFELNAPRPLKWLRQRLPIDHYEACNGNQKSNIAYCTKTETRIDGPWEFGTKKEQGKRTDLHELRDTIIKGTSTIDIIMNDNLLNTWGRHMKFADRIRTEHLRNISKQFRKITTVILSGPAGTGKTRYIYENHKIDEIYKLDNSQKELWFDGYEGQKVLLIDDFYGWIKYSFLLKLLDGYPLRLNVKGGSTYACWTHIYVTSNEEPALWYKNKGLTPALDRRIKCHIKMEGTEEGG